MTTRGLKEADFEQIAVLVDTVLQNPTDDSIHQKVTAQVKELCERFPLYDFVTA